MIPDALRRSPMSTAFRWSTRPTRRCSADESLDAIYVPLANSLHARWSIAALEAGHHVLCEKPFASNAAQAADMVAAADRTGRVLVEAYHWRYHPVASRMLELAGAIGPLVELEARFSAGIPSENVRYELDLAGGSFMDLGCYCMHMVRTIAGDPEVISATAVEGPKGIDLSMEAVLRFPDSIDAVVSCSMIGETSWPESMFVRARGRNGDLKVLNPMAPQMGHRIQADLGDGTAVDEVIESATSYEHQLRAFYRIVSGEEKPITGGADAVATMAAIDDGLYRFRAGHPVLSLTLVCRALRPTREADPVLEPCDVGHRPGCGDVGLAAGDGVPDPPVLAQCALGASDSVTPRHTRARWIGPEIESSRETSTGLPHRETTSRWNWRSSSTKSWSLSLRRDPAEKLIQALDVFRLGQSRRPGCRGRLDHAPHFQEVQHGIVAMKVDHEADRVQQHLGLQARHVGAVSLTDLENVHQGQRTHRLTQGVSGKSQCRGEFVLLGKAVAWAQAPETIIVLIFSIASSVTLTSLPLWIWPVRVPRPPGRALRADRASRTRRYIGRYIG